MRRHQHTTRVLLQPRFPAPAHLPGSVCLPLADLGAQGALSPMAGPKVMVQLFCKDCAITRLDIAARGSRSELARGQEGRRGRRRRGIV